MYEKIKVCEKLKSNYRIYFIYLSNNALTVSINVLWVRVKSFFCASKEDKAKDKKLTWYWWAMPLMGSCCDCWSGTCNCFSRIRNGEQIWKGSKERLTTMQKINSGIFLRRELNGQIYLHGYRTFPEVFGRQRGKICWEICRRLGTALAGKGGSVGWELEGHCNIKDNIEGHGCSSEEFGMTV